MGFKVSSKLSLLSFGGELFFFFPFACFLSHSSSHCFGCWCFYAILSTVDFCLLHENQMVCWQRLQSTLSCGLNLQLNVHDVYLSSEFCFSLPWRKNYPISERCFCFLFPFCFFHAGLFLAECPLQAVDMEPPALIELTLNTGGPFPRSHSSLPE